MIWLRSTYDFKRVIGIEFSPKLCRVAEANLSAFQRATPTRAPVDIIQANAVEYEFSADQNVFFLFNPFDGHVLQPFLDNLERSLVQHPRQIWIIYNHSTSRALLDRGIRQFVDDVLMTMY